MDQGYPTLAQPPRRFLALAHVHGDSLLLQHPQRFILNFQPLVEAGVE